MALITVGWWPIRRKRGGGIHGHGVAAPVGFQWTAEGYIGERGSIAALAGGDSM
jgi:hypothetical protein